MQWQHILKSHCQMSYSSEDGWVMRVSTTPQGPETPQQASPQHPQGQRHPNRRLPDTPGTRVTQMGISPTLQGPMQDEHKGGGSRVMCPVSAPQNFLLQGISTQLPPCPCIPETVSEHQMGTRSFWDRTTLPRVFLGSGSAILAHPEGAHT